MSASGYRWLTPASEAFLGKDYLLGHTVDERVTAICQNAERILERPGFAEKFREYFKKGWYSFSSPIWANFGLKRGLPISCFGSHVGDSIASIIRTHAEVAMMTKFGGGTSATFHEVRPRGSKITDNGESNGSVNFMMMFETLIHVISQGNTRRGQFAAYLPIDHGDIKQFLHIRHDGDPIMNMSSGVTVTDAWMESMIAGDAAKREVWAMVLASRAATGYPYIVFLDNVNNGKPDVYKHKNMQITHQNLCSEICLPSSEEESFVCDLSSMNIKYFDEWKDTDAVELMVYFLDAVMTEFIDHAKADEESAHYLSRAIRFAERHRALGIGWFGWHDYLQSKMIPFEGMEAMAHNAIIAKNIKAKAEAASARMAVEYGEPEVMKGYGRRHTTLTAIAPTKSSAFIIGQAAESIEPHRSNYYIRDLEKMKFSVKNEYLEKLLEQYGKNTPEIWDQILKNSGSVSTLAFLSDHERAVFKTLGEIAPICMVNQVAQRQKYIDQGQSLNLRISPSMPIKEVNALIIHAWRSGVKSLYYQINVNAAQNLSRSLVQCESCSA